VNCEDVGRKPLEPDYDPNQYIPGDKVYQNGSSSSKYQTGGSKTSSKTNGKNKSGVSSKDSSKGSSKGSSNDLSIGSTTDTILGAKNFNCWSYVLEFVAREHKFRKY